MSSINLFLIVVSVAVGVLNAVLSSRIAPAIARFFARRAAGELPPPSSHRLQPAR